MKIVKMTMCISLLLGVNACSTSQDDLLPSSDTTMAEIWAKGGQGSAGIIESRQALQFVRPAESSYAHSAANKQYTRDAANEATNLFPRLPNPDLVMYIFPHLTSNAEPVPVPGYSTVFPFYGRVQYAMPGERTATY